MTSLQPFSLPPRWLTLRLLPGGVVAAGLLLLKRGALQAFCAAVSGSEFWLRCASSLLVLALALLLALCVGLIVGLQARQAGPRAERLAAVLGRALACVPVVVLAWGFISGWSGRLGWPVESLMPAQFPDAYDSWRSLLAHHVWNILAPVLILALPLCGEMVHAIVEDGGAVVDLDFSLRARGVPGGARLWRHHLSQLRPLLRVRLQALSLIAPVYLIIIEDALRFMGWGEWLAQGIRAGAAGVIALGFISGGGMLALVCACLEGLRGRLKSAGGVEAAVAWQPWLFWAFGLLVLLPSSSSVWLVLWAAVLISGSAGWHQAWRHIEAELPVDAARVLGATEHMIWRSHVAAVQLRLLAAWICTVFAQTLLCMAAACALKPQLLETLNPSLARMCRPLAIATVQEAASTLADPAPLLESGGGIALAALCLIQVSRMVQPRLH